MDNQHENDLFDFFSTLIKDDLEKEVLNKLMAGDVDDELLNDLLSELEKGNNDNS